MRIFGGIRNFFWSAFGNDSPEDEKFYGHHTNAGVAVATSARDERADREGFNLADIRIPSEDRVMDAEHAWQQELTSPGYGEQSDLYISRMLERGAVTTREELLDMLYYGDIPELDEGSVETILDMELRDLEDRPPKAASG